ncbi:photosystem I assembly protein Ycf3 [Anatilimnocola aggregata]|uniref:Photosystem I assembly protein Ycf3 n=1 Tax=Anatilimnocola aggregata TaxID=2528021 RepID=A0A517Y9X4_9BACT|nr:tetratricopeptide repeat protein [Anatilimnocola aggregata]QDU27029.1 photosystem I assembly protein Ycf3 [Anatilimnocola aggregata]
MLNPLTISRAFALLVLTVVWQSGCASLSLKKPSLPAMPALPTLTRAKTPADEELPTAQTVKLCLTTAAELTQQGHLQEAILLYEKARALDPEAADYSRLLASLYDGQENFSKAKAEYELALQKYPADPNLLNDFGCLNDRQGNFEAAEGLLRQAIAAEPTHDRAKTNLAITLAHQSKYKEAFVLFSEVSGPAAAHSNLGTIMARQGRAEDAKSAFRSALEINPAIPQARAMLDHLENKDHALAPSR